MLRSLKEARIEEEVFSKEDRREEMPKILQARVAQDEKEERQVSSP